jgi:hypothetical protein
VDYRILVVLMAALTLGQTSMAPRVTPRKSLPISQGPIKFVDPRLSCPPHKGDPVRLIAKNVQPPLLDYTPPRVAPITGRVLVEATIQQDGTVAKARALRGPESLHEPAVEAVRQWKFAKTCLNGLAIPVVHVVAVRLSNK